MESVLYLSLVTASISYTVSEKKLFLPLREWAQKRSHFLGSLLSWDYCFGHWMSFALMDTYQPRLFEFWWLLDYFLTALLISWLSAFQWVLMYWLVGRVGK